MTRQLVGRWPAPVSLKDPIALPYCDNITVLATTAVEADTMLEVIMTNFRGLGLEIHEVQPAATKCRVLGCEVDGEAGTVRPDPIRAWRVKQALAWSAS